MGEDSFQITLQSNCSAGYFPDKKPKYFQVKLPSPITVQGESEVALVDVKFDNY